MSTINLVTESVRHAVLKILKSLVRVMIRNSINYRMCVDMLKWAFYEVAWNEFNESGEKQNANRVSMITGLPRKEILRFNKLPSLTLSPQSQPRGMRIIRAWVNEPQFHDDDGQPAILPFEGKSKSFSELVKLYSGDVSPRGVLEDLLRIKAVKMRGEDVIELISQAYIPQTDSKEKIKILGDDVSALIDTINHNIIAEVDDVFFQRRVAYNNIPEKELEALRKKLVSISHQAMKKIDNLMVAYDSDENTRIKGKGNVRAGIGMFYFEKPSITKHKSD